MPSVIQAGAPFGIDYSTPDYATGLFIRCEIIDVTNPSLPVIVTSFQMNSLGDGAYFGTFTPVADKTYYIKKTPFTDGSFTVIDYNHGPGSETVQCINIVDSSSIIAGVWNALTANYQLAGSMGAALFNATQNITPSASAVLIPKGIVVSPGYPQPFSPPPPPYVPPPPQIGNYFTIFQGDDVAQTLQLTLNGDAVDLSGGGTDVEISLENEDGTSVVKTLLGGGLTAVNLLQGKFALNLDEAESALLLQGQYLDVDAVATIASRMTTFRFYNAMNVVQRNT